MSGKVPCQTCEGAELPGWTVCLGDSTYQLYIDAFCFVEVFSELDEQQLLSRQKYKNILLRYCRSLWKT